MAGMYGGGGGDGGAGNQQLVNQYRLQVGTKRIDDLFKQYGPDFYNQIGKNYIASETPQVMQQYGDTRNRLAYALARNGILNSSAAVSSNQSLKDQLSTNLNTVANNAQNQENQMKQQVSQARSNLMGELIASNDPSVAQTQGAAMTAGLTTQPNLAPIGNMFGDWANAYLVNMNARAFNPTQPSLWQQLSNMSYSVNN